MLSEQQKKQQQKQKGVRSGQTGGTPNRDSQAQLQELKMKEAQLNQKLSQYAQFDQQPKGRQQQAPAEDSDEPRIESDGDFDYGKEMDKMGGMDFMGSYGQ